LNVVLLGATGKTGREVLRAALAAGHTVTALTRDRAQLAPAERLTVVEGRALDPEVMGRLVEGQDAVLQCLGIGGKGDGKPNSFVSDATAVLVEAMRTRGVRRLVCMSNVGAGDSWGSLPWIVRAFVVPVFLRWLVPILDDKNRMEPMVTRSGLDWTLVRFPAILDGAGRGTHRVSTDGSRGVGFSIRTPDAATFLVGLLASGDHLGQAVSVSG
jgi:uncharacterized protein YbjT (DUF2867 family)